MSSSWKKMKTEYINRTPSPTLNQVVFNQNSRITKTSIESSMKRISLFISGISKNSLGSMTVEAAFLLPLILFFFLHLMSMVEMLRLHGKLTFGLWECGNELAVYSAVPQELGEKIPDIAVSYVYVKNRLESFLGKEYLDAAPVVGGRHGINYLSSTYKDGYIDIGVTYQVKPPISVYPFPYVRLVNRYYGKSWTGYDITQPQDFAYVTTYGDVWHSRADCTHIFISVQSADWHTIKNLRNQNGGKYYPCELCEDKDKREWVYYTDQGNRYHTDENCSALVRYIRAVNGRDTASYRPCSRCVKAEGE